jgi:hypothetical protein
MKNPALTGGVSLQFKLRLTRLLLALVPHILANRGLVDAHGRGEKSSCPDPTTIPLHVAQHVREFLFQLPTAYSAEFGRRFRANPATRRSPATQSLSDLSSVADFRPIWLPVCASILL